MTPLNCVLCCQIESCLSNSNTFEFKMLDCNRNFSSKLSGLIILRINKFNFSIIQFFLDGNFVLGMLLFSRQIPIFFFVSYKIIDALSSNVKIWDNNSSAPEMFQNEFDMNFFKLLYVIAQPKQSQFFRECFHFTFCLLAKRNALIFVNGITWHDNNS